MLSVFNPGWLDLAWPDLYITHRWGQAKSSQAGLKIDNIEIERFVKYK